MLDILVLVLFIILIVYFVISGIVIYRYKKMQKISDYLIQKYHLLNRKSFVLDRCLCLYNSEKINLEEVNKSFFSMYKDIIDIDSYLNKN